MAERLLVDPAAKWPAWFHVSKNTPTVYVERVRRGRHPVGLPLHPDQSGHRRCGNCSGIYRRLSGNRRHIKCVLARATSGPATDVRLKWYACAAWTDRVTQHLDFDDLEEARNAQQRSLVDETPGCRGTSGLAR